MPPKAKAPGEVEPRRSTRTRAKRPADTEEQSPPNKQPGKKTSSKSQGVDSEDEPSSQAKSKRKVATRREHDANEDMSTEASKTTKASKSTKATKQQLAKAASGGTKQTSGEPSADSSLSIQAAQKPSASAAATKSGQPLSSNDNPAAAADPACPKAHSTEVAGDADVMLNQTNINANNNNFYRMQLLQEGPSDHWLWTRWGRVGDKGQTQLQGPFDADTGLKEFNKKFRFAFRHIQYAFHYQVIEQVDATICVKLAFLSAVSSIQHWQCKDVNLINVAWQLLLCCQLGQQLMTCRACFRPYIFSAMRAPLICAGPRLE